MFSKIIKFLKKNYLLIILILVALYAIDLYRSKDRLHEDLIGKTQEFEKLSEYAALLERKYIPQEELQKKLEEEFKAEKEALEGRIKILSNATFLIREKARVEKNSDISYQGSKMKYVVNELRFENGPAVGYVLIFDDGRVVSKIYNHEIDVKTAVARDEASGKYSIVSKANYILKSPSMNKSGEWFNKPYPLKIVGGTAFIDPTEPIKRDKQFFLFSPNVNANLNFSAKGVAPGLGVSIMGYGESKRDLDWKFLQFGAQLDKNQDLGLTFNPVLYRPFGDFLSNTYIGPGISFDKNGSNLFLGLQIGF